MNQNKYFKTGHVFLEKIAFLVVLLFSIGGKNSFAGCEKEVGDYFFHGDDFILCAIGDTEVVSAFAATFFGTKAAATAVVDALVDEGGQTNKKSHHASQPLKLEELEGQHARTLTKEQFLAKNSALLGDRGLQEELTRLRSNLTEIEGKVHGLSVERAEGLRKLRLGQLAGALFALPLAKQIYDAGIGGKSLAETPEAELYGEGRGFSGASSSRAE